MVPEAEDSDLEPRWLDQAEMAAWLGLLRVTMLLPAALEAQLQRDAGVTQFEYLELAALSDSPGRTLRMSTLAGLANGSLSRLSHVVRRLEGRGWVFREPCPQDGRVTNATLTDEGYDKLVATAPGHVAAARELVIDRLSRDRLGALAGMCESILTAIDTRPDSGQ